MMLTLTSARGRLPPELVDMIIDYLHDDKTTLASCALVAKNWLTASRMHLFEEIILFHDRSAEPYGKFAAFLESKPSLRPLVRTLCLNGYHPSDQRQGSLDATMLDGVISQLPSLETLLIVNSFWNAHRRRGAHSAPSAAPPYRASLKNLYISFFSAEHECIQGKLEILRHFKEVERLQLDHVWLGHFGIDGEVEEDDEPATGEEAKTLQPWTNGKTHPEITSLSLSLADICLNFLAFLWRQPFISTVKSFSVQDFFQAPYLDEHEDLTCVGDLIQHALGPQLTHFEILMPRLRTSDSPEMFRDLHLASCTSLLSTRITMLLQPGLPWDTEEQPAAENGVDEEATVNPDTEADPVHPPLEGDNNPQMYDRDPRKERQPPQPYTTAEWNSLVAVLASLPSTLKSLTIAVELPSPASIPGSTIDARAHLASVPDWDAVTNVLNRFTDLEKVVWLRRVSSYSGIYQDEEFDVEFRKVIKGKMDAFLGSQSALQFGRTTSQQ